MAHAISNTISSVLGSSITTVAGFTPVLHDLHPRTDLGIVMAKGVILGVIGCVTVLPALLLLCDKAIERPGIALSFPVWINSPALSPNAPGFF